MPKRNTNFNGRRVAAWCKDAGITQDELAARLGVKKGRLSSWITGERRISFDWACRICNVLDKSLDELRADAKTVA